MSSYGPLAAHNLVITEQHMQPSEAGEQPSNESNPDVYKASLESTALHVDQFNAVLLQILLSCSSRRARRGRLRNDIRSRGAKFARRQFTTLRRCISEALSTSHETTDGLAFMRFVLQHHPYYGKITMTTAIVRRLSPDLVRSVASKDRRIVANVAMNMIKRWVSQRAIRVDDWAEVHMRGSSGMFKANSIRFDAVVVPGSEGVQAAAACDVRN
ncbi:hypothetical protein KXX21_006954 [Aspergillus fumigatus]|nr:hypothetical protein KXX21_006954 [Aspergillus fumigatus]KMK55512.1 hypothetical protein Y699_09521 [Aspergillus fumigatus Z5]